MGRVQVIRLMGPVDVGTADGIVSVEGRQQRVLLAALAVAAGRAVPTHHLREVLWREDPPASADSTLQSYVSDLRSVLGHLAIRLNDRAYELDLDLTDIDALRFEQLVHGAATSDDPDECLRLCREALALWRGRPFGDLADDEAFLLESHRLDELRLTAMELSIEAELALGLHELIVGELESAVEEHPYREHLWYLLIVALARGGRRVEALRSLARLRHLLGDVGLGPEEKFVTLEHEILEGKSPSMT